ncbi:pyroglutamylated RF-amide peptide receptor-like [Exaiptasia diaphana]|uniref:G-protein coupled receptors family 1 profile domain-containing protein n=1 Tax=Exaiptasia diaphana TaxID=2652724 RepID=A0A913WUN3_EXADI|nr:pyroglutamylated RF-amide peptide receptor-like [Exaiptasia diaphana]
MRKPVDFLVVNLATSDAVFSAFLIPRFIVIHAFKHPHGQAGDLICKFFTGGNLTWTGGAASVFTLVAIALERYYAVVFPHMIRHRFTRSQAKFTSILAWLASLLLNIPLFFVSVYSVDQDFCIESWASIDMSKVYSMIWFISVGVIPFSVMAYCYIRVIYNLWGRQSRTTPAAQLTVYRSRKKVTKIVLLVTLVYLFTWFPSLSYYAIVAYLGDQYSLGSIIHRINQILTAINAASNPFIYAFQSHSFRQSVIHMWSQRTVRKHSAIDPIPLQTFSPVARNMTDNRRFTITARI